MPRLYLNVHWNTNPFISLHLFTTRAFTGRTSASPVVTGRTRDHYCWLSSWSISDFLRISSGSFTLIDVEWLHATTTIVPGNDGSLPDEPVQRGSARQQRGKVVVVHVPDHSLWCCNTMEETNEDSITPDCCRITKLRETPECIIATMQRKRGTCHRSALPVPSSVSNREDGSAAGLERTKGQERREAQQGTDQQGDTEGESEDRVLPTTGLGARRPSGIAH